MNRENNINEGCAPSENGAGASGRKFAGRGHRVDVASPSGKRANRGRNSRNAANTQPGGTQQRSIRQDLIMLLMKTGLIAVFLVLMFTLFFGIMQQPDNSMAPAIKEGDLIVYYRLQKDCEAGDTLILQTSDGERQCRRVVAAGGDSVDITDQGLEINGYPQQEQNIYTETLPYKGKVTYPVKLETGQYFVLGDARETAGDSRVYGAVAKSVVRGKVITIIRRRGI